MLVNVNDCVVSTEISEMVNSEKTHIDVNFANSDLANCTCQCKDSSTEQNKDVLKCSTEGRVFNTVCYACPESLALKFHVKICFNKTACEPRPLFVETKA